MKLKRAFTLLSVLTILLSVFATLLGPPERASAAMPSGWINRRTINWPDTISGIPSAALPDNFYIDTNTYDNVFTFVSQKPNPNGCDSASITFSPPPPPAVPGRGYVPFLVNNSYFYYSDANYGRYVLTYRYWEKRTSGTGSGTVCAYNDTSISGISNPDNRRVVFVKSVDGNSITNIMNGVQFNKAPSLFGSVPIYEEAGSNSVCKDVIILHEANSFQNPPTLFNGQRDGIAGSSTLYAVRDAPSDEEGQYSESYVTEILGLNPGETNIVCHIATRDNNERVDITSNGGYGVAPGGESNTSFLGNGLRRSGGWFENGVQRDDATPIYVGQASSNTVPGDEGDTPIPVGDDQQAGTGACDQNPGGNGLGWLFCAFSDMILGALGKLDSFILNQLKIDTDNIFGSGPSGTAFRKAWSVFRTLAYALLVLLGLVMIVSQVMGLDLFDAYTIRKMLPKLVAAVIIIPLLWPILRLFFEMANDSADAISGLLYAPFKGTAREAIACTAGNWSFGCIPDSISVLSVIGVGVAGGLGIGAFLSFGGFGVLLALLASAFLAIISAVFILLARDIIAYALIITSPIAVVCAIFEPFKKVFTLWRTFLVTILIAIPAVAAVLAASKIAAKIALIADQGGIQGAVLAIIFIVMGYFLFWKTFQALDKVSSQLGNVVGNITGKAQKALGQYRSNAMKHRMEEAVEGRRSFGGPLGTGWLANRAAGVVRRGKMSAEVGAGAWGLGGKAGRSKYAEAVKTMQSATANKMMEHDKDRAGGDDDAMRLLARRGMTGKRFISEYAAIQRRNGVAADEALKRAHSALGLSETSLGAHAGTNAMRVAAQRSLLKSNTSYRKMWVQKQNEDGSMAVDDNGKPIMEEKEMTFRQMNKQMYGDVAELVHDGLITVSDGTQMIKSNGARADRAGLGWGSSMGVLNDVAVHGAEVLDVKNDDGVARHELMADEVLTGTGPGQLVGQRHEAVRILAPEMLRRAKKTFQQDGGNLDRDFVEQIAMAAGRQDLAGQLPELNSALQATNLLGQDMRQTAEDAETGTVGEWIDFMRSGAPASSPIYQRVRAAAEARVRADNPGVAFTPDQLAAAVDDATSKRIQAAQRTFQEYRREYSSGYQAQGRGAEGSAPTITPGAGMPG